MEQASKIFSFLIAVIFITPVFAQPSQAQRDSIYKRTQTDYKNMLLQLQIDSTRRGPSGTPGAPNAANADETKATTYTSLPDALVLKNGKKVTDTKTWINKRRPEIMEILTVRSMGAYRQTRQK
jgi:hypothetical protein